MTKPKSRQSWDDYCASIYAALDQLDSEQPSESLADQACCSPHIVDDWKVDRGFMEAPPPVEALPPVPSPRERRRAKIDAERARIYAELDKLDPDQSYAMLAAEVGCSITRVYEWRIARWGPRSIGKGTPGKPHGPRAFLRRWWNDESAVELLARWRRLNETDPAAASEIMPQVVALSKQLMGDS